MKLYLVAIYDTRAQEFAPPMAQHTMGTAERTFSDIANDPQSPVNKHPDDYQLHHIGYYDTTTGQIEGRPPELLCTARQFIQEKL